MARPVTFADPIDKAIGANLRALRQHHDCTQVTLAAALGVTFQQLQKYESGRNRMSAARLYTLARYFRVPCHYFFHGLDGVEARDMGLIRHDATVLEAMRLVENVADPALRQKIVRVIRVLME